MINMAARQLQNRLALICAMALIGVIFGLIYGYQLRSERMESRIFLGSYPNVVVDQGRPIETIARSLIVPSVLTASGYPPRGFIDVEVQLSDASILLFSSVPPKQRDIFRALHEKIAEKIRERAASVFTSQKETLRAKITALKQSITTRETAITNVLEFKRQLGNTPTAFSQLGKSNDLMVGAALAKAELDATLTAARDDVENRVKLDQLETELANNLAINNLFSEPAVVSVAEITSVSGATAALAAAIFGAFVGSIVGLTALAAWAAAREVIQRT